MARNGDTIKYQFTPVPTQLYMCMDLNCRSVLFTLLQLSSLYADENGWFFRTNADLESETKLSINVLKGALDALYQKNLIGIIPQQKGRGKKQTAAHYKVNEERFKHYEQYCLEDCCKNPSLQIETADYKHGSPSYLRTEPTSQPTSQLTSRQTSLQSDNNIDTIDKIDIEDIKEDKVLNNNILNKNILVNTTFEVFNSVSKDTKADVEVSEDEREQKPSDLQSSLKDSDCFSVPPVSSQTDGVSAPVKVQFDVLNEAILHVLKHQEETVNALYDNYCDDAFELIEEDGNAIYRALSYTLYGEDEQLAQQAFRKLLGIINTKSYNSEDHAFRTAIDIVRYFFRRMDAEAQEAKERTLQDI